MSDIQRGDERRETKDRDPVSHKYTPGTVPHTPTPWKAERQRITAPEMPEQKYGEHNQYSQPYLVCQTGLYVHANAETAEANAAHIVLCVNSHDRLVTICQRVLANDRERVFLDADVAQELITTLAASQPTPDHE